MSPESGISPARRPLFARLFLSPDEPRLRAGWRLLIQAVLALAFLLAASLPVTLLLLFTGGAGLGQLQSSALLNASISLAGIVLSVCKHRWLRRIKMLPGIEHRDTRAAARRALIGVVTTKPHMLISLFGELGPRRLPIELRGGDAATALVVDTDVVVDADVAQTMRARTSQPVAAISDKPVR